MLPAPPADYLLLTLIAVLCHGLLHRLKWRGEEGAWVARASWILLAALLTSGWWVVDDAGRQKARLLQKAVAGLAATYADDLARLGHSRLTQATTDPHRADLSRVLEHWRSLNPSIAEFFTLRRNPDGRVFRVLGLNSGEQIPVPLAWLEQAFAGQSVFHADPHTARAGEIVSAFEPLRGPEGTVEAVLGINYDSAFWLESMQDGRLKILAFLSLGVVALCCVSHAAVRRVSAWRAAVQEEHNRAASASDEALSTSDSHFTAVFHASPVPMALLRLPSLRIADSNAGFAKVTGHDASSLASINLGDLIPDLPAEHRNHVLSSKAVENIACKFHPATGAARNGRLWLEPLRDGKDSLVLLVLEDISERLAVEDHLRQAQKMETVGQLAAGVAHDFNNLLAVVQGHASLRLASHTLDPAVARSLGEINEAAQRAATLTRQLLAFSRRQDLHPQLLNIAEVFSTVRGMLRRLVPENIQLTFTSSENPPLVRADLCNLEQVLFNLVLNARDAMPQGGAITISCATVEVAPTDVGLQPGVRAGSFIKLEVADTGSGIPPEILPRIFEPFFTTKEAGRGTGMGLATVHGVVQQHNGWITVQSAPNSGTRFIIHLPAAPAETATNSPTAPTASEPAPHREWVLVLEDDPAVRATTARVFKEAGYRVVAAASGEHASDAWRAHPGRFALLVADLVLPGTRSGMEWAGNFVQESPGGRVLLTSGYSLEQIGLRLEPRLGWAFLPKPYPMDRLLEIADRLLRPTPARAEPANTDAGALNA